MIRHARAPHRRTALLTAAAALTLGAPGLVLLAPAPAPAVGPCLSETPEGGPLPPATTCDDATPPITDVTTVSPAPTIFGYTRSTTVTFALHGHYTDADVDPLGYQYQFWNADTQVAPDPDSGTWTTASSSTLTMKGLGDSTTAYYHLRVRAVDTADNNPLRIPSDGNPLTPGLGQLDPDTPDLDTSFDVTTQEVGFRIDTAPPNTFLTDQPTDDLRPDQPAVTSQTVPLSLNFFDNTHAIAGFYCTLNDRRVACGKGTVTLTALSPGKKTFRATTIDRAGNVDPVPVQTSFWVPQNLTLGMGATTGRSCTRTVKATFFAGDVIECTKKGDQLHFAAPGPRTREIRLIAPAGPRLGVVEVSIGEGRWIPVDLFSRTQEAVHTYLVRDQYEPPKGGQVRIRVKTVTAARPYVRVDAVLARP